MTINLTLNGRLSRLVLQDREEPKYREQQN